jgi:hypothetical protein
VADGANGVFGAQAGDFPSDSWQTSNYFVDAVVDYGTAGAQEPQVTSTTPLDGADGEGTAVNAKATFSVALDPSTVTASTFTLRETGSGTPLAATVSYDESARRAKLVPSAPLDPATSYTATLSTGVQAHDGTPLGQPYSWHFTTAGADAPAVTAASPLDDATQISGLTAVRATFSGALDPSTVGSGSFVLDGPAGSVPATVSYESATHTAVLQPSAPLAASTTYTATLTTDIESADGVPAQSPVSWHFTTSACPCSLLSPGSTPNATHKPVQDGRPGPGPFSYEMGVKITVSQPAQLTAIRFYKSTGETGSHVGKLWTSDGTLVGLVTFSGETASGWQEQALGTPIALTPGQMYVVSVSINDYYVVTLSGLASSLTSGPLSSVADGANGVYGSTAGAFPTDTWSSSNYYIDAVVR